MGRLNTLPENFDVIKQFTKYVYAQEINTDVLNDHILRLNNYGICVALIVKGEAIREQANKLKHINSSMTSPEFLVQVYPKIQTLGIDPKIMDLVMTPRSSYHWKVRGGPNKWEGSFEPTIYLNDRQIKNVN